MYEQTGDSYQTSSSESASSCSYFSELGSQVSSVADNLEGYDDSCKDSEWPPDIFDTNPNMDQLESKALTELFVQEGIQESIENLQIGFPIFERTAIDFEICPSVDENVESHIQRQNDVSDEGIYISFFTHRDVIWIMNDGSVEFKSAKVQIVNFVPFFESWITDEERLTELK